MKKKIRDKIIWIQKVVEGLWKRNSEASQSDIKLIRIIWYVKLHGKPCQISDKPCQITLWVNVINIDILEII